MAKKRKHDQLRQHYSDATRPRSHPYHAGVTSRANDGTSREEIVGVIRETVLEFKDAIQVKAETEKEIDKLKEKEKKYEEEIGKLNEEVRILKEGHEDHKKLKEEVRILKEGMEDHKTLKEEVRILKEEQIKLKEVQEFLMSQIQEMQRRCAEVDHYRASPSQRSQPNESPNFRLVIENTLSSTNFKNEYVTANDCSGRIKVGMYVDGLRIASDNDLASVKVALVLIDGRFDEDRKSWSEDQFEKSIIKPRPGIRRLVENGIFELIGGRCDHEGAKIMDNSQQKEVKLGVRVTTPTGVRVLEGVSNPFKVQESKTKPKVEESKTKASKKHDKKPSPPVPTPNLEQPTSTHATEHGQGPVSPDEQHSLSAPVIQDVLHKEDRGKHTEFPTDDAGWDNGLSYTPATVQQMVEGNGQANGNGHRSSQQIRTKTLLVPTSTYSMQHEFLTDDTGEDNGRSYPSATVQQMVEGYGQAQNANGPNYHYGTQEQFWGQPTSSNPLQHGQVHSSPPPNDFPLYGRVIPCLPAPGQDQLQYTNFPIGLLGDQRELLNGYEASAQETDCSFIWGRVLLQWDTHVELKKHCNFLDQLMPLYSTKSRFYTESFPSTSLMDKAHKLLASISSDDSVSKMITSGMSQATQTPRRRGVLTQPIRPYDSEDEPPLKKLRNAKKYQLRFVNRVCNDYYTGEQIKSEDGTFLKIALYDENNLVVTSGPLSSASVEVVLLHGDFNAEGQQFWTSDEFSTGLVHPQYAKEPPALGGDRVLALTDGEANLGNVNFRTSSFHARTGKFKMGVVITNVREENVQEGITSPFVVRVRLGEEPSRQRITSLESLLRGRVKLPNQVCVPLERDTRESVSASSALHDQSSQVISILETSSASDRLPEPSSQVISVLGTSTASDRPRGLSSQVISPLGASMASDRPPEPSWQGVEWSPPSALLKDCAEDVKDEEDVNCLIVKIRKRIKLAFLSIEKNKNAYMLGRKLAHIKASFETLERYDTSLRHGGYGDAKKTAMLMGLPDPYEMNLSCLEVILSKLEREIDEA